MKPYAPQWIIDECNLLGLRILNAQRIGRGSVGESWQITTTYSKLFFKKVITNKDYSTFNQIITSTGIQQLLPVNFTLKIKKYGYIQYYLWIDGIVLSEFSSDIECIFNIAKEIHCIKTDYKRKSSYLNIFDEINSFSTNDILSLPTNVQKDIDHSISIIINKLSPKFLAEMCDNCGFITHGDIKPLNVVRTNIDSFRLIDWDKICTVSREFDIAYMIYTGIRNNIFYLDFYDNLSAYFDLKSIDKISLILEYLPHIYLLHDVYNYTLKKESDYLLNDVYPMYISWRDIQK